ncbi:glycosyltransferase family 4 protein [Halanaerobium kushneri]|uniref:Glycosyltransferase involved in cell wall bisynthesis n=1 Tax=Halanaerobium kushneri TaxID=56779 RepID=A0A1N7B5N5_9FIRM|nr:glycosyltransferase family 4 protein [Halanaerobium kushneri]SIR46670.1 Glycosyltransferase involved in cell wall bisynthesis [Halanaerobium kushneri]
MAKIIHIINKITITSIPFELANSLSKSDDVIIISLYDSNQDIKNIKKIININLEVIPINMKTKLDYKKVISLFKILKSIKPNIIHTHHTLSGFLARIISKILGDIKVVTTIHTDIRFISWYQKFLRLSTLNFADQIVFNSNNTKKAFTKWDKFLSKNLKRKIIYNGVDIDKILEGENNNFIRKVYKIEKEKDFVIGTVGRLEEVKDHRTLIKAFSIFIKKYPDSKLIIVGSGSQLKDLIKLSNKLDINDKVIFTGLLARESVYKVINELDLFAITSKYEGFCNAMVEAMVAENAIIASNIEPLPEVLGKNNGVFFDPGNAEDLADKIFHLYQSSKKRKDLARKAKEYAIANYSLEKCVDEYKKVYQELLS